jgi:hypothetical protein
VEFLFLTLELLSWNLPALSQELLKATLMLPTPPLALPRDGGIDFIARFGYGLAL